MPYRFLWENPLNRFRSYSVVVSPRILIPVTWVRTPVGPFFCFYFIHIIYSKGLLLLPILFLVFFILSAVLQYTLLALSRQLAWMYDMKFSPKRIDWANWAKSLHFFAFITLLTDIDTRLPLDVYNKRAMIMVISWKPFAVFLVEEDNSMQILLDLSLI